MLRASCGVPFAPRPLTGHLPSQLTPGYEVARHIAHPARGTEDSANGSYWAAQPPKRHSEVLAPWPSARQATSHAGSGAAERFSPTQPMSALQRTITSPLRAALPYFAAVLHDSARSANSDPHSEAASPVRLSESSATLFEILPSDVPMACSGGSTPEAPAGQSRSPGAHSSADAPIDIAFHLPAPPPAALDRQLLRAARNADHSRVWPPRTSASLRGLQALAQGPPDLVRTPFGERLRVSGPCRKVLAVLDAGAHEQAVTSRYLQRAAQTLASLRNVYVHLDLAEDRDTGAVGGTLDFSVATCAPWRGGQLLLHPRFVTAILEDVYGIQVRASRRGCCSPYACYHHLPHVRTNLVDSSLSPWRALTPRQSLGDQQLYEAQHAGASEQVACRVSCKSTARRAARPSTSCSAASPARHAQQPATSRREMDTVGFGHAAASFASAACCRR